LSILLRSNRFFQPVGDFRLVTERRSSSGGWESAVPQR
jgi:hypothetical protein